MAYVNSPPELPIPARGSLPRCGELLGCPMCERTFTRRARQQVYCSDRCRERGRNRSRKAFLGTDTGAPTHPHKSASAISAVRKQKNLSSVYANTPLNILGGGSWRWPDTPLIDEKTWAKIVRAEVGAAPWPACSPSAFDCVWASSKRSIK